MENIGREEKKVEYLELIYDLIFVYIIGRNNSILHSLNNGFVSLPVFLTYVVGSLAIIQIWNYSTFYTNMFGKNSVRDHIFMFVNMYLLYYIGEGTRVRWEGYQNKYHIAWALILINIGIQYLIELRIQKSQNNHPNVVRTIRGLMASLFGEAAVVLIAIPVFNKTGIQLAGAAIGYGIMSTWLLTGRIRYSAEERISLIDFAHLSERAMLYVVFTFGEMIIAIASYFEEDLDFSSVYFSGMCFLIVVGLFLCYELLYNHIIDREMQTSGMAYMMIHIFLIFGMNNITTSLEFMRDPGVRLWPKTILLTVSFLLLFGCMFLLLLYAKAGMKRCRRFLVRAVAASALFAVLMILFREKMYVNVLVTVFYVLAVFLLLFRFSRQGERQES